VGAFLIVVLLLGLAWFMFVLPARRRQRSHESMQDALEPGDEIITAGGLHATIVELGDSELQVEIAPEVVVTLDRRAVAAVAQDVEETVDDEEEEDQPETGPEETAEAR
jgi:preprotein translocase subunit YajC